MPVSLLMHVISYRVLLFTVLPLLSCGSAPAQKADVSPAVAAPADPMAQPPTLPSVVNVGEGGSQRTEGSVRPWLPADPTKLTGRYRLLGITDGHGWLDIVVRKKPKSSGGGVIDWQVEAKLITEWTKDDRHTLSFQGASLERDAPIPYFEVGRRHLLGFFVQFTDRSDEETSSPENALIIGPDVFVRDDSYKPRPYR